jgi:hypothetical protein
MFNRIKNILVTPKTEWPVIDGENRSSITVLTTWVLLLAAIPAVAALIGYGVVGVAGFSIGIKQAIIQYLSAVAGVYITAFVIDALAKTFDATKNFDKAFSLVAYAWTPSFVGGIFYLIPALSWLAGLCSIYSLVLLYFGMKPMMKVSAEKLTGYFVVSLIVMVLASIVLGMVLASLIIGSTALSV